MSHVEHLLPELPRGLKAKPTKRKKRQKIPSLGSHGASQHNATTIAYLRMLMQVFTYQQVAKMYQLDSSWLYNLDNWQSWLRVEPMYTAEELRSGV